MLKIPIPSHHPAQSSSWSAPSWFLTIIWFVCFRFKNDAIILDQDVHKLSQPTATAGHLPEFSQGKPSKY
jgi:hypothetical protein